MYRPWPFTARNILYIVSATKPWRPLTLFFLVFFSYLFRHYISFYIYKNSLDLCRGVADFDAVLPEVFDLSPSSRDFSRFLPLSGLVASRVSEISGRSSVSFGKVESWSMASDARSSACSFLLKASKSSEAVSNWWLGPASELISIIWKKSPMFVSREEMRSWSADMWSPALRFIDQRRDISAFLKHFVILPVSRVAKTLEKSYNSRTNSCSQQRWKHPEEFLQSFSTAKWMHLMAPSKAFSWSALLGLDLGAWPTVDQRCWPQWTLAVECQDQQRSPQRAL